MLLIEQAPAPLNPIPLREFAGHLRLAHGFDDDGSEDPLLELYLRNATAAIERRTGTALIRRPFVMEVDCWDRRGQVHLPIGPASTIDTFVLVGQGPDLVQATPIVSTGTSRQVVSTRDGGCLPHIPAGYRARLEFTAGFGDTWNTVPDDLRQAVLMLAAHYYETRFGETPLDHGLPHGVQGLIEPYRAIRI